jgi:hypothetical protein
MKGNQVMKNQNAIFTTILLTLGCFALCPVAQAVSPAPDGGYPGGNTAEGQAALLSLTTGGFNTAVGFFSLRNNSSANFNTATGAGTLLSNTTGDSNTANGVLALFNNITGAGNTAAGVNALFTNNVGSTNTAIGYAALGNNAAGNNNTAIGIAALIHNTTGSNNIGLGNNAGSNVSTANNVICIGADGNDVDNSCYIGNIFGATSVNGVGVLVNSNGRLGTMTSSARFKDQIKPMDNASEALFALKPVAFRYKKEIDPDGTPQLGLVAEEVEKVNADLVVRDKEGKPYSVRYDQVNAMLLNEFLKEHRKVEKLEAAVAKLAATVKEQAVELRRVSAQVNHHSAAELVLSNR